MTNEERLFASLRATMLGRVDSTAATLREAAKEKGFWISADDRIGESDLATLLGMTPASLANKRREGSAPSSFALGGGGHRVTYRLTDAAAWLESHHS